ncbi:MAG: hypothetical protein H6720_21580 [Sandaracinus sp.]|nr:hypothetical protein [Sandaracinus sp.]MCB9625513.1 hypothetical protein [Sandaracinus sp.]
MRRALPLLAVLVVIAGALGFFAWQSAREEEALAAARFAREQRAERAEEDRNRRWEELGRASAEYVPGMLGEVRLGLTRNALLQARPGATPPMRTGSGEPRLEEALPNGAQVVYVLDRAGERVARVQVLSQIPAEGVPPHLQAMRDQYGDPQVVLRCSEQSAAGVPTLRFVWGDERVAMQDIFLIHPRGVSVTLYVAGADALADSLRAGGCAPVRSREELDQLGVATPEMLAPRVIDP